MARSKILLSLAFIVLAGIAIYFLFFRNQIPIEELEITFSPKWVNQAQFAGVFTAIEKGYYKKYGLTVRVKEYSFASLPMKDLKSGASQLALMSANDFLLNYAKNEPIKAIAAFFQVSPLTVLSLKQQNITSPRDLRGKRLGLKGGPGAEGELIYSILLKAAGITEKQNFIYVPFGTTEYEDLASGKVDTINLYRTDQPFQFEKAEALYNAVNPEQYGSAVYNDILVATTDFLTKHPNATRAFIQATSEGWQYTFAHPEEAVTFILRYVTDEIYKDPILNRYILDKSQRLIQPTPQTRIGNMELIKWQKYYETLQNLKLLPRDFNVAEAFTTEYLLP